jgi:hypothetical protein
MADTKNARATKPATANKQAVEDPREITRDVVDYLTEYARDNPGHAALFCLGVGFVLGWKLKPW